MSGLTLLSSLPSFDAADDGHHARATMLPAFNEHGLLPRGDYELTLDELRGSVLVQVQVHPIGTPDGDALSSTTST